MKKIITVASIKGGVGKTSSSICFAYILSENSRVLLIDLDSQASLTSYFIDYVNKAKLDLTRQSTYNMLKGDCKFMDIKVKINDNLDFLPSYINMSDFTGENLPAQELRLRSAIVPVLNDYDYILIDTPPSKSKELVNAIIFTDFVLVPLNAEIWSIESLALIEKHLRELGTHHGFKREVLVFLSNFKRNTISQSHLKSEIEKFPNYLGLVNSTISVQEFANSRVIPSKSSNYYKEFQHILANLLKRS